MDSFDASAFFGISAMGMAGPSSHSAPTPVTPGKPDADLRYLEDRVDRLSLICMAMWSLMRDKTGLTEQELMDRVQMIDLMDGVEDGKATRTVMQCGSCSRPLNRRHKKCLYCGHEKLIVSAFDAL